MRGLNLRNLTWTFAAVLAISGFAPKAQAATSSPFPQASCPVKEAIPSLKSRISDMPSTSWDGDLPWPDVLGIWLNPSRDLYMIVYVREITGSPYGIARVFLKSVCTDEIMAEGSRIITEADFKRPYLTVRLRNYQLVGSRLTASIRVPSPKNKRFLEVKIHQQGTAATCENEEKGLRDWFIGERLE